MRIGLLTTSFPRHAGDVAGAFVLDYARSLTARGHAVEVLAPEPLDRPEPLHAANITVNWVPYVRPRGLARAFHGAGFPDNAMRSPFAWLGAAFPAAAVIRGRTQRDRWDAVVSHWAFPMAFAGRALAGHRPHLTVFHSSELTALERSPAPRALARAVFHSASTFQFVSEHLAERFAALLPPALAPNLRGRSFVQPMPVPALLPVERETARANLGLDRPTVLSMGRLVPMKRIDLLLRAAAALGPAPVDVLVAGDGPEREALERLANELGVSARFVGVLRGDAKRDALAAADAFVSLSTTAEEGRTEGQSVTLLEAVGAGLPVVTTDAGGVRDLFWHGGHLSVVDPTVADVARAIRLALSARVTRDAAHAASARTNAAYGFDAHGAAVEARLHAAP
ncbi:MAG: glycosyltransferase family 4 protein [Polyangiales bacterium]|nr:glycosyltransferase family 4 protein [Myxococcales bacterium]